MVSAARMAPALGLLLTACREEPRTYSTQVDQGTRVFEDHFERAELGDAWRTTGPGAEIHDGALVVRDLQNHPVWLVPPLPLDFRIEFDAWTTTDEGDLKVEVAGDGKSSATSPNYVASGYVVIFGGWNNTLNAIVRRNEHGSDRQTTREPRVAAGQRYHFALTRQGSELRWELDGREVLTFDDLEPLRGPGHEHFAFSGWLSEVHFDNLVVEALEP